MGFYVKLFDESYADLRIEIMAKLVRTRSMSMQNWLLALTFVFSGALML